MDKKGKLELTWVGKYEEEKLEPRILIEDKSKSYGESNTENMLIHGDNLLALKALENKYTGMIKCIYIDPPYNTGAAFEHYDDNLEHSIWLGIMKKRLEILRNLLAEDGTIWIQIDDEEQAYLKVLCDEIFGRSNFVNMISVNMKNVAGASGGGEDKRLKKNCEYILVYAKNYDLLIRFIKPPLNQLGLFYKAAKQYNPDFLVETADKKYMIEVKAANQTDNEDVQEKAKAAIKWCECASQVDADGKTWEYRLVPGDKIIVGNTFKYVIGMAIPVVVDGE